MTRPRLEHVQRTIGPDEPMPAGPVRSMLGPEDFAAYLAERAQKSRTCPVDRISGLDGFLTAILIGPRFLDPRDWIAVITGKAALSARETTREHRAVQAIAAHYNRVSIALSETPEAYRPLFDNDPLIGVETIWWFLGFRNGRDLARDAWVPVDDPTSPAYRFYDEMTDALSTMPVTAETAKRAAHAVIGLRNSFRDARNRSHRQSR